MSTSCMIITVLENRILYILITRIITNNMLNTFIHSLFVLQQILYDIYICAVVNNCYYYYYCIIHSHYFRDCRIILCKCTRFYYFNLLLSLLFTIWRTARSIKLLDYNFNDLSIPDSIHKEIFLKKFLQNIWFDNKFDKKTFQ